MKIFYAAHSLKGTIESIMAARIAGRVLRDAEILPVTDGGDGFADTVAFLKKGGRFIDVDTVNANHNSIKARYYSVNRQAYIESASVIGLKRIRTNSPILQRDTEGLGIMINHALRKHQSIYVGLGGSATADAGAGMLKALGNRVVTDPSTGAIKDIEILHKTDNVHAVYDVCNALPGKNGAIIYAGQKGADEKDMAVLRKRFGITAQINKAANMEGAGAAGGLGFAFIMLKAQMKHNMAFMNTLADMEEMMRKCDVFATSEGQIDNQTFSGKITGNLIEKALEKGKRVIVISGGNTSGRRDFETILLPKPAGKAQNFDAFMNAVQELKRRANE